MSIPESRQLHAVAVACRLLHPSRTTITLTTSAATASAHHNPSASEAARLTRLISASRAATAVRMLSAAGRRSRGASRHGSSRAPAAARPPTTIAIVLYTGYNIAGTLATVQAVGDFVASAVVGVIWTLVSPTVGFAVAASAMVAALVALLLTRRHGAIA